MAGATRGPECLDSPATDSCRVAVGQIQSRSSQLLHCQRIDTAEIFAPRGAERETNLANLAKMSALYLQPRTMIRFGQRIRLTRREVERFTKITGIAPMGVCTLDDLAAYVVRCKEIGRASCRERV